MTPLRHPAVALLLVLLVLLGGPGCGGSRAPGATGGPPPPVPAPRERHVSTDPAGAELSFAPAVAWVGDAVLAAWSDRRAGLLDIHANRSLDGGRSWGARDVRLDGGLPGAGNSWPPRLSVAGDAVAVVWYDDRNGFSDIYLRASDDAGATWGSTDVRVNRGGFASGENREPAIARDGATVVVVWRDDRHGGWALYGNRSTDGGRTWLASDVRIDRAPGVPFVGAPALVLAGPAFVAAWRDRRDGADDLRVSRSGDGGVTWSASDVLLGAGSGLADDPILCAAGAQVTVVWRDRRRGPGDVLACSSQDAGQTWAATGRRLDTDASDLGNVGGLMARGADGVLHVVWHDDRDGLEDIRYQRSVDGGATWLAADRRLDDGPPGASASFLPSLAAADGRVAVAWQDARDGRMDIRMTWSPDAGASWWASDVRLDDDEAGAAHSITPVPAVREGRVVVVWSDQRDGPGDILGRDLEPGLLLP